MTSVSEHDAARVMARLDALAADTDEPGRMTRLAYSPALRAASQRVLGWMREAGMTARVDAAGNVVGHFEAATRDARSLMIGSHLDTVRDGGRFDGPLGVVAGIAVVERLHREGRRLPLAIEVIAFADEEGVRFGGSIGGSAAVAGTSPAGWKERRDGDGVTAAEALRRFGLDPDAMTAASRQADPPLSYIELHIEQGPVLERAGLPLGCVTGIAGATRLAVTLDGHAAHAGTVPMGLRRDALAAAAECVLAVEALCPGDRAVGTVGHLRVEPDASNVIPGRVRFSVDLRSADDACRLGLVAALRTALSAIAARRGIELDCQVTSETQATPCASILISVIADGLATPGRPALLLPSGAGHDGIAMSAITDVGMIFMRCAGGVSHNPAESVTPDDLAAGLDALFRCCVAIADRHMHGEANGRPTKRRCAGSRRTPPNSAGRRSR